MFDMMQVVTMGDFTDRQDVISRFTFIAVFNGVFWAALVLPNIRLQSVQKQTHFQTVEDYQQAVESFQFPRTELWLAGLMFAIAYLSMAFGSAVLGMVFMLLVPIMLGVMSIGQDHRIGIHQSAHWSWASVRAQLLIWG